MSFFEDNALTQYTTPPNNYIGSALFLSYIVVALYLITSISYSLCTQYASGFHSHPSSPPSKFRQNDAGKVETRNARARHIKIYLALALISFISISWNMLGFLITSFLDWSSSPRRDLLAAKSHQPFQMLKQWMLQTGLFNDFALQLVADGESAVWAQLDILATWGWNLWLAYKGVSPFANLSVIKITDPIQFASTTSVSKLCFLLLSLDKIYPSASLSACSSFNYISPLQT